MKVLNPVVITDAELISSTVVSNTGQTSRILKRWEGGGMPTVRNETP